MSRQARFNQELRAEQADVGQIPPCSRPELLADCRYDLHRFLQEVFPNSTGLRPFGADQVKAIKFIEQCVLHGGRFAQAFPRGYGKTAISVRAALWALLYGHRRYIPVFGANKLASEGIVSSAKTELAENDILLAMFPAVCHPIRCLEGKPQRCASQTHGGELTHIKWTADKLVLPTIEGSIASGSVFQARPMKSCRGLQHTTPAGAVLRPDFVIVDDPQTDEDARSQVERDKLLDIIRRAILRLGGHNKTLAAVMNATVIELDDVADTILSDPAWQSCRYRMVQRWSDAHETFWLGEYAKIRRDYDRGDPAGQRAAHARANELYRSKREIADAGAAVSWEWCYAWDDADYPEISAIQHAYNILIDDGEAVFASECQNEPLKRDDGAIDLLTPEQICRKANGIPRGTVPVWASHLVGFIDSHKELLFWSVLAVGDGFRASVVDYGTYPEQGRRQFRLRDARPTISSKHRGMGLEASLRAALDATAAHICGREWKREDGAVMRIGRLLADANWGEQTDTVYEWARASQYSSVILPSHGKYLGATSPLWGDRKREAGEINGLHWRVPNPRNSKRPFRHVLYDTNFWKSFVHERLGVALGSRGSFELFGRDHQSHRLFAEHMVSEKCTPVTAHGRTVQEWKLEQPVDNHWLDCLVGCAVAASMMGCSLDGAAVRKTVRRKRVAKALA